MSLPSNPADLKKIDNALQEISNCMTRIEAEKDLIKDIKEKIKDDHGLPPRLINQLAKVWHMRNFAEEVAQQEEFQEAYEQLVSINNRLEAPEA